MRSLRSLFAKTLLWFLATTAIAIGGMILTTALTFRSPEFRGSPFNMLLRLQVEDLKRAYESGGQPALAAVMARFQNITQSQFVFTDAQGTDLLTGQARPDLHKRMGERPRPPIPFIGRRGPIIARSIGCLSSKNAAGRSFGSSSTSIYGLSPQWCCSATGSPIT